MSVTLHGLGNGGPQFGGGNGIVTKITQSHEFSRTRNGKLESVGSLFRCQIHELPPGQLWEQRDGGIGKSNSRAGGRIHLHGDTSLSVDFKHRSASSTQLPPIDKRVRDVFDWHMSNAKTEFVKVHDLTTGETTTIPASELAVGMVRIRFNDSDEILWVDSSQMEAAQSAYRHPPFTGALREKILYIEQSLQDVFPKNYEQWEDGFRRDLHAEQEIDLWVRVSRCLNNFIEHHGPDPEERQEAFKILGACLNSTRSTVFQIVSERLLDRATAEQLADAFFLEADSTG